MALTKIFTGMEKGPEAIDANFKELDGDITDSGWQTAGITYLNGCAALAGSNEQYRVVQTGSFKLVYIDFSISVPALAYGTSVSAIQLPNNVPVRQEALATPLYAGAQKLASWDISESGVIAITSRDTTWTNQENLGIHAMFIAN